MPFIIYPTQCAFVPKRNILDDVMIVFEVMHVIKRLKHRSIGAMALKLYMAKAYDRVEWCFVEALMLHMGFAPTWVARLTDCINTDSFLVSWKGNPLGSFVPSRGVRQGC